MSSSECCSPQREALAAEVLRQTGRLRMRVRGESMLPALRPGDIAEIVACSVNDVASGEIVLAYRDGRFFLHRFLARGESDKFLTRGESMPGPDPEFPPEAILGKVVTLVREARVVPVRVGAWSRAVGLLFCYCSFARRAALRAHKSRNAAVRVSELEMA